MKKSAVEAYLLQNAHRIREIVLAYAITLHIILVTLFIYMNRLHFDVDAVSYLRTAQYYLDGRIDLAINAYWGPLHIWEIVLFAAIVGDPLFAARIACGVNALVFLLGSAYLFKACGIRNPAFVVCITLVALFSATLSPAYMQPDLLVSGLLVFAIGQTFTSTNSGALGRPFLVGVVYGVAYLAKPVALPIGVGIILLVHALQGLAHTAPWRAILRSQLATFVGLAVVSLPWIVTISLHYDRPLLSTSGIVNHALVGPQSGIFDNNYDPEHPYFQRFHIPQSGRVAQWEDPNPADYTAWSPLESSEALHYQIKLIWKNFTVVYKNLSRFDVLHLGLIGAFSGFFFQRAWRVGVRNEPWRLIGPVLLPFVIIYLPVYAKDPRYFLALYPLLMVAAAGFLRQVEYRAANASPSILRFFDGRIGQWVAIALLIVSFSPPVAVYLLRAFAGYLNSPCFVAARDLASRENLRPYGPIVTVGLKLELGLYLAYLTETAFYGSRMDNPTLEEIKSSAARTLIIWRGAPLNTELARDPQFRLLFDDADSPIAPRCAFSFRIYRIE